MKKTISQITKTILTTGLIVITSITHAGTITGGSDLLTSQYHTQLENWLGKGSINLINIFDKQTGDNANDFHAAVDGKGPTFSLIEIFNGSEAMIIGGYNQDNWNSSRTYSTSNPLTSESFLFNLSTGTQYNRSANVYDTYNHDAYGPVFGSGHDLYINYNLSGGYANLGRSYGNTNRYNTQSYQNEFAGSLNSWTIGAFEVFTYENSTQTIPEPTSILLMGLGLLGLTRSRKRNIFIKTP